MPIIAIALVLAAVLGGGTAVAAQQAQPGDMLYGFKTNVNENVETALAFSAQDKANVDISLAQERLDEAQKLAAAGKLDASTQSELTANFNEHAADVATQTAKLEAAGNYQAAADVAAKFQSTLADESGTMASTNAAANASAQASLAPILTSVRSELNTASNLSTDASAQAAMHTTANGSGNATTQASSTSGQSSANTSASGSANASTNINASASSSTGVNVNLY